MMKMKQILAWVLALTMVVSMGVAGLVLPASAEGETSVVKFSEDFEGDAIVDKFSGWTKTALFGSTIADDPTDPSNKVWKIVKASTSSNNRNVTNWGFQKGRLYKLAFRAYIDGTSGYVQFNSNKGKGIFGGTEVRVSKTKEWVSCTLLMQTTEETTFFNDDGYTMYMKVSGASAETPIYLDDFVFTDIGPSNGTYLLGGDFEEEGYYSSASGEWKQLLAEGFELKTEGNGNTYLYHGAKTSTTTKVDPRYNGRIGLTTNTAYELCFDLKGTIGVSLTATRGITSGKTGWSKHTNDSDKWETVTIPFTTGNYTKEDSYVLYFGFDTKYTSNGACLDNIYIREVGKTVTALGAADNGALTNGTVYVKTEKNATAKVKATAADAGDIVTVTVAPNSGYMLKPGSLAFATYSSVTENLGGSGIESTGTKIGSDVKILNEEFPIDTTFGGTAGNTFQFVMPADYSVLVSAEFIETATTNFALDTVGTSLHKAGDTYDGIRYLTRLNLPTAIDEETKSLEVLYEGVSYPVLEIGSLLKRSDNGLALDYATAQKNKDIAATRMWITKAFSEGRFGLVDYTDSYIDFASVMMTKYTDRSYTARGYIILDKNGNNQIDADDIYEYSDSQVTNSIASTPVA